MSDQDLFFTAFRNLSRKEAQVLYLRCLGLTVKQAAIVMNYSKSTINKTTEKIYAVFGFDKTATIGQRLHLTRTYFCTYYTIFLGGKEIKLDDPIWDQFPDIEIERNIVPSIAEMVRLDNEKIEEDTEQSLPSWLLKTEPVYIPHEEPPVPPEPDYTRRDKDTSVRDSETVFLFIVLPILCIAGAITVGYFMRLINPQPSETAFETSPPQVGVPTKIPTRRPTPIREITPIPENINIKVDLPFEDTFDFDLRPEWRVIGESPFVTNGALGTDDETWLLIGNNGWRDYSVEFAYTYFFTSYNQSIEPSHVGVRAKSLGKMVSLQIESHVLQMSFINEDEHIVVTDDWPCFYNAGVNSCLVIETFRDFHRVLITVENNIIQTYLNGEFAYSVSIPERLYGTFVSGGVIVHLQRGFILDYVRISPIQ